MKRKIVLVVYLLSFIVCLSKTNTMDGQSNDHMFPPAASAKAYIDFDAKGFLINGKRTFLVSAGLEYARIPHQLWHDRLLRLKRCGFNCIEIYTFWNFHEPQEGKFDFSGDHDLNGFLQQVKELGMYAIVRVGPYYCAEWDLGGYPLWLRYKDNMEVRKPNAEFEKYVDRFFNKLIPIVAKNQINHGGAVILVQLENEHPASWGTYVPNEYFAHLQKNALSNGVEVPYFFSGLNHGGDPAQNYKTLDDNKRPNPWFTTEFWSVWYNLYGSGQKEAEEFGRRTWKIIAHGGNGYNYYMAHGGTNFDYSNSHEDAASYDYGAAVGQTGDLRPIYYQFKRNALFARSFQDILENSSDADLYKDIVTDTATIHVNTRHGEAGDIVFLDNPGEASVKTQLKIDNQLRPFSLILSPGEIMPVVCNFKLINDITIDWAVTRILGISNQGNTHTLVVYGPPASQGELKFSAKSKIAFLSGKDAFKVTPQGGILKLTFKDDLQPAVYSFKSGNQIVRIISVNTLLADRTWFAEVNGKQYVIMGPEYLSEIDEISKKHVTLTTEHFWDRQLLFPKIWVYTDAASEIAAELKKPSGIHQEQLLLNGGWQMKDASGAVSPAFDDSKWKESEMPLELGADGDLSADTWYRTTIHVKDAGRYKLNINKGGGRFIAFIDSVRAMAGSITDLQFDLTSGDHKLVIFAAHDGRDKLYNFTGVLGNTDIKGIAGKALLHKGETTYVSDWKILKATNNRDLDKGIPSFDKALPYRVGDDPFNQKRGYAWFQTEIPTEEGRIPLSVNFRSVDDKAIVFINGKEAGSQDGWNAPFSVPFTENSVPGKSNLVTVFIENRDGRGGIDQPVELVYKDDQILTGWRMKGGPGDFNAEIGWKTIQADAKFDRPTFFRNTFNITSKNPDTQAMWRISLDGLHHGSIWVNGHNLGRYPERIPINSLYIPECWLKMGSNTVIVYDEYGNRPDKVTIQAEKASSRDVVKIKL